MVISEELMKAVKPFVDLAYAAQDVDMVAYNDDEELALHATGAWSGACVTKKQCRDLMSAYKNTKSALEPQGQALPELPTDEQMKSAIRELFDNAPYNDGVPFVQCSDVLDVIDAVYAALRQPSLLKLVGEAGSMPGTSGFTMACFKADEVPLGTKLYARVALCQQKKEVNRE